MTDSLEAWILQYTSGIMWTNKLSSENSTKRTYLPNFKKCCDWAKKTPDELIELKVEGLKNINSTIEFQAENLLEKFLSNSNYTATIKAGILTAVLSFYRNNHRPLVEILKIDTPESQRRCPKIQDIVELENGFGFLRDKALLWFLASSPFRLETIPKIKWRDLKPTNDKDVPYSLVIESDRLKGKGRGKYKGLRMVGFIHSLANQKLEAYKKEHQRKGYIINDESPIFIAYRQGKKVKALSDDSIDNNFAKASLKSWGDLETKRFSPHDFRDFVQSAFESAGINSNIIAPMLGHKPKGVDFHYSDHDVEELLIKYKSALPYLLPQTLEKLKNETNDLKARYEKLQDEFAEQLILKQKETMKAVVKMLKIKGIKVDYQEEGEEND